MSQQFITKYPKKLEFLLGSKARFKVLYGGRGSGKSYSIALALIQRALYEPLNILCARDLGKSIIYSVHQLLSDIISHHKLDAFFDITQYTIKSVAGATFIFTGLRSNPHEIKSLEGIDICWIEEATKVPEKSWEMLVETIRNKGSEIWISFNPDLKDDPVYVRYVENAKNLAASGIAIISELVNYHDNPFFYETQLPKSMEYDKKFRPDIYNCKWLGNVKKESDALIFRGKYIIDDFDTPPLKKLFEERYFYGLDFGFNPDPLAMTRSFIYNNCLYIDQELYQVGLDLKDIPDFLDQMPEVRDWLIKADCARPDIISMLNDEGFTVEGASKTWEMKDKPRGANEQQYIKAGIEYLCDFEKIIIHTRCTNTADEFGCYSKKIDKITDKILPIIEDKYNHCLTGDSLVKTDKGNFPIKDLVGKEGKVYCYNEDKKEITMSTFKDVRMTSESEEILELELENGKTIRATADHLFYTSNGWKRLIEIDPNIDMVLDF